ncbi:DUF2182 domain-containing protein [Rhodobacterales bacterium]|nr:DUF2182 domain-containing protein [Rhodobacterales bacterium]
MGVSAIASAGTPVITTRSLQSLWRALALVSLAGLLLSALLSGSAVLPSLCTRPGSLGPYLSDPVGALALILAFNSPWLLVADWLVMLAAMMPMLLAAPIAHVRRCSLRGRAGRATLLFCLGYCAIWTLAAPLLVLVAVTLGGLVGAPGAVIAAVLLALVFSATPVHRSILNRAHLFGRIGLFGARADRDCLRFGLRHGAMCLAGCWAWMLVPLVAGDWHLQAMVIVTLCLLVERLAPPSPPRWRLPAVLRAAVWHRSTATVLAGIRHG